MKKKALTVVGKILTLLSIIFIIGIIINFEVDFKALLNGKIIIAIILLGIVMSIAVFLNSVAWKILLQIFTTKRIPILKIYDIYAQSNMGKYLPGNVMQYASRNIYGAAYGIKQSEMIYATILEILLKVIAAAIVGMAFLNKQVVDIIRSIQVQLHVDIVLIIVLMIVLILGIIILLLFKGKISFKSLLKIGSSVGIYAFIFLTNAFIFMGVTYIIEPSVIKEQNLLYGAGIYVIAWLIGYLTPGAPGGVGIRESIMIILLSGVYTAHSITLVSVIVRIITVAGDMVGYGTNFIVNKKYSKEIAEDEDEQI